MIVFDRRYHDHWTSRVLLNLSPRRVRCADYLRLVINTEERVMPPEVRDHLRGSIGYLDPPV